MTALNELPPAPLGKSGWPWTEEYARTKSDIPDGPPPPKISIITCSYNQGAFIEEAIRSVLLQGYPNLEFIIIDDGSTDGSIDIIKKYGRWLAHWQTGANQGQSRALNKGFRLASGELVGWQNSDDYYHPGAFHVAAEAAKKFREAQIFYGSRDDVGADGKLVRQYPVSDFKIEELIPYLNICNQSMFFRREVFKEDNFLDESLRFAMDQEFFIRLALKGYKFTFIPEIKGYYRVHPDNKSVKDYEGIMLDFFNIYKSVFLSKMASGPFREKALFSLRLVCFEAFLNSDGAFFRRRVKELASISGPFSLGLSLSLKYLFSLFAGNTKTFKQVRESLITH